MSGFGRQGMASAAQTQHPREDAAETRVARLPILLTIEDAAELLRTSRRAVYAMIERRQLPGVVRLGRRVLLRSEELLHWLNQKSAPSLKE
jgi:excisionase family DNA binding protein